MKSANILKDVSYNEKKPAISVLMETTTSKEIRIVFAENQHMKEHQTPHPITVELVEGNLDFGVEGKVCIWSEVISSVLTAVFPMICCQNPSVLCA